MSSHLPSQFSPTRQSGAALISGLIFLVVLTMIGITSARMSTLEERMSGNMRDRSLAMQAAELALRDAERDILTSGRISGITNFVAACTNGLCYNGVGGYANPVWTAVSMTAAPSVQYSAFTSPQDIPGVSAQPRYLIEGIRRTPPGGGVAYYYRITVRAQGVNPNTVVWLQEVFRP
jgi:type IV pilus assembly protein PilX